MAFDVVMFGSLCVPERNVEEWLTTPIELAGLSWLDELSGADVLQETPEALLSMLADVVCLPHELFRVSLEDGRVTMQAYASEDTYRQTSQALALLMASAAEFGGVGELHFAGYQGIRFGERFVVRSGRCTFSRLSADELTQMEFQSGYAALEARIHERFDVLVGRTPSTDVRGSRWVINPFTGRKVRVSPESERT